RNEARSCSMLSHPHIVQVLSFGINKGETPFIVMELLEGKTLEQVLLEKGKLNKEEFREIFIPVLDAIAFAHSRKVVHRDLKPANIMVLPKSSADGQAQIKVLDFGIAKDLSLAPADLQLTTGLLGSPLYMSPEQCAGKAADFRSDVYSLACVMYQSIVGQPPFTAGSAFEVMHQHLKAEAPTLSSMSQAQGFSDELLQVLIDSLSKEPDKRPQSAAELQDKISAGLKLASPTKHSKAQLLPAVAVALSVFLAFLLFTILQKRPEEKQAVRVDSSSGIHRFKSLRKNKTFEDAESLAADKNFDQAIEKYQLLINNLRTNNNDDDNDPQGWLSKAHLGLAKVFGEQNKFDDARREYKLAIDSFDEPSAAGKLSAVYEFGDYLLGQGKAKDAVALVRDAVAKSENSEGSEITINSASGHLHLAQMFIKLAQDKDAFKEIKLSLEDYDKTRNGRFHKSAIAASFLAYELYKRFGQEARGLKEIEKARSEIVEGDRWTSGVRRLFAKCALICGFPEIAREMIQKAMDFDDDSPSSQKKNRKECESILAELGASGHGQAEKLRKQSQARSSDERMRMLCAL
ncbi:MAG: protein kinase, partial [Candidatus Obscuribacterales bacterium]|nr:protein kinase [Candidatus Obscuribacterales bacterium]